MRKLNNEWIRLVAIGVASCLALPAIGHAQQTKGGAAGEAPAAAAGAPAGDASRAQLQAQVQGDIDKRRQDAEQQGQRTLDQDAVAAIADTEKVVAAIASGNRDEALAAMERVTGKINLLVARNPAAALIPVRLDVEVIDLAPHDLKAISAMTGAAERAVDNKDYPAARAILEGLVSELRVRTFNLPLATYPAAMKEAARLLDAGRMDEANAVLLTALHTLVVTDHATPLPLVVASAAIDAAQLERDQDKDHAQKLLALAKVELDRAKGLGYAGKDPEYLALNNQISDLEKQLKGKQDTASAFTKLKEKVASFFKRQSESEKGAQVASR